MIGFKTGYISQNTVMLMTILLCLFFCPHNLIATETDCSDCVTHSTDQDLCDCSESTLPHDCGLENSHAYTFRADSSFSGLNLNEIAWICTALLTKESQLSPLRFFSQTNPSVSSYVVRHLDSIILRV